jgi:hypothetical protein
MSKARFVFPLDAMYGGYSNIFDVSIISYTSGYEGQFSESITRDAKHYYPIRIKENPINIRIQCKSIEQFDNLTFTIAKTQEIAIKDLNASFIRFSYPELFLNYLGYIDSAISATTRFVQAPIMSFVFTPYLDTINTIARTYSNTNGTWKDIVGLNLIDLTRGPDAENDQTLKTYRPFVPTPRTTGGPRAV